VSDERRISAELQNAFVDGELDPAEWERVAAEVRGDGPLREDVATLRALKDMVRHAYAAPPAPVRRERGRGPGWKSVAVASVAFAVAGWFAHAWWRGAPEPDPASASMLRAQPAAHDRGHLLVHVSSGERAALARALDEVEYLLRAARGEGRRVEIEVVADSTGLELLRARASPFAARIAALRTEYDNISFTACGQTLQRLSEREGPVELLPGTRIAPSALDEVVKRLQDGWVYVRA
jgi:intracellular sulfur oxidation DsrE/DsrF family protein